MSWFSHRFMDGKKLWGILVPRCSRYGKEYPLSYHKKWDEKVRSMAGGITILRSAKGHWVNHKGKLFVEEMIPVMIYCNEQIVDKIIKYTLKYYHQESVMAYEISSNVKLVKKKKE